METIDNIVREMRKLGNLDEKSTDRIPRKLMGLGFRTYADRIEKAVAKNATTTPRRNCDVYTMAEQSKRHEKYCTSHTTDNGRCGKCPLWQMRLLGINCAIAFANLPYEKEGVK
jgi:hypothetical protein